MTPSSQWLLSKIIRIETFSRQLSAAKPVYVFTLISLTGKPPPLFDTRLTHDGNSLIRLHKYDIIPSINADTYLYAARSQGVVNTTATARFIYNVRLSMKLSQNNIFGIRI